MTAAFLHTPFFPLCSLSTKYVKGQSLTANAKGLVWFLSSTALLFIRVLFAFLYLFSFPAVLVPPSLSELKSAVSRCVSV